MNPKTLNVNAKPFVTKNVQMMILVERIKAKERESQEASDAFALLMKEIYAFGPLK